MPDHDLDPMEIGCSWCFFWAPKGFHGTTWDFGECHRFPPTKMDRDGFGQWPLTDADTWCGEARFTERADPVPPIARTATEDSTVTSTTSKSDDAR